MFGFKTATRMKYISRIGMTLSALLLVLILLFSYYGQNVGSFTIDLSRDLRIKNMVLSETKHFENPGIRLEAEPLIDIYPIGIRGEPEALPLEITLKDSFADGSDNGLHYFAYTFYVKNQGGEPLHYNMTLYINNVVNNVDAAIRVMIISNKDIDGDNIASEEVYAKVQGENGVNPGKPELGTKPFFASRIVVNENRTNFKSTTIDKYTVLMWIHGEDVDSTDIGENSIIDGKISLSMKFSVIS